jgi:hypothetical protein
MTGIPPIISQAGLTGIFRKSVYIKWIQSRNRRGEGAYFDAYAVGL